MLRRNNQIRTQVQQWVDGGLCALALWLAHVFRDNFSLHAGPWDIKWIPIPPFYPTYFTLFLVIIPLAPLVLETQGFYKRSVLASRAQIAWQAFRACVLSAIGMILVIYMLHYSDATARGVMVLFGVFSFALLMAKEELIRWTMEHKFGMGEDKRRMILVGAAEETARLRQEILDSHQGLEILGVFDLNTTPLEKMVQFLHENSINGVLVAAKHTAFGTVEKTIQACELEGIEAWLMADFFNTRISRKSFDEFNGQPVLVFSSTPALSWSAIAKQALDFFGALVLILLSSPGTILAAMAIKLTSRGPIFFRQRRAGLYGKPFTMYKFRSMVSNAEQLKQDLQQLNEMSGPVFKVTNDPRVTKVGVILRKFSIDEFPQLLNVLKGEMSLVGPRPLPVDEVARFDDLSHRRRLSVRPGLTCLWQVSGRSNLRDFDEWVRLDLQYIDNWSLWLDCKILLRTVPVVLLGKGAH